MPDEGDRVHEETTDPLVADARNFYKVEKWTRDGTKVDSLLYDEPPDIDVDFKHERREEVIQWIYETYGRTRSALTAVVSRYRARGAIPA
jgi:hypothetical protein